MLTVFFMGTTAWFAYKAYEKQDTRYKRLR